MLRKGSNSTLANNLPVQSVGAELHSQSQELQFVPPSPAKEVQVRVTRLRAMQIWLKSSHAHPLEFCSLSYSKHRIHDSIKA